MLMGFLIQQTWLRGATHSMRESIPLIVELSWMILSLPR